MSPGVERSQSPYLSNPRKRVNSARTAKVPPPPVNGLYTFGLLVHPDMSLNARISPPKIQSRRLHRIPPLDPSTGASALQPQPPRHMPLQHRNRNTGWLRRVLPSQLPFRLNLLPSRRTCRGCPP